MRKNNKGFSLVEMIVAFAILAIAGVAIMGFMQSGQNSFTRTSSDVGLQYEQQVVVNQLRDVILESTNSAQFDEVNNVLYTFSEEAIPNESNPGKYDYKYYVTKISFVKGDVLDADGNTEVDAEGNPVKQATGTLYWATKEFEKPYGETSTLPTTLDEIKAVFSDDDNRLLGEDVTDIEFDMTMIKQNQITFTIGFAVNDKVITSTQVVTLRNKLSDTADMSDMFYELSGETKSFIKGVTVYRVDPEDGIVSDPALVGSDIIKTSTSGPVTVQYAAIVTGNDYSERDYAVTWSLTDLPEVGEDGTQLITVDTSSGRVTVDNTVPSNTVFTVVATSVDDPTKKAQMIVRVLGGGIYPVSAKLTQTKDNDGSAKVDRFSGKNVYYFYPTINYDNNTSKSGTLICDLLTYEVFIVDGAPGSGEKLIPVTGDYINAAEGTLTVTSQDEGLTFKIIGTVKQRSATADFIVTNPSLYITVDKVMEAKPERELVLTTSSTKDNLRGSSDIYVAASWINSSSSYYEYHWTIEPENVDGDSNYGTWGTADTVNFKKCISFYEKGGVFMNGSIGSTDNSIFARTNFSHQGFCIKCEDFLDWNKAYRIKVSCYATDPNEKVPAGKEPTKIGLVDENGNYGGPAVAYINFEPVKIIVTPYSKDMNKNTIDTGFTLKNAVINGGNSPATRRFQIYARGLYLTRDNLNNYDITPEFVFKNAMGERTLSLNGSGFYGPAEFGNGLFVGFKVNVRPQDYWNGGRPGVSTMLHDVSVVNATFRVKHKTYASNNKTAYFMASGVSNYHNDENLTPMLNVNYTVPAIIKDRGPEVW